MIALTKLLFKDIVRTPTTFSSVLIFPLVMVFIMGTVFSDIPVGSHFSFLNFIIPGTITLCCYVFIVQLGSSKLIDWKSSVILYRAQRRKYGVWAIIGAFFIIYSLISVLEICIIIGLFAAVFHQYISLVNNQINIPLLILGCFLLITTACSLGFFFVILFDNIVIANVSLWSFIVIGSIISGQLIPSEGLKQSVHWLWIISNFFPQKYSCDVLVSSFTFYAFPWAAVIGNLGMLVIIWGCIFYLYNKKGLFNK